MSSYDYTTFMDGKGYRFTLPALGVPDEQGEWVLIQAALTTDQLDTLAALSKATAPSTWRTRSPSLNSVTVDVQHDGALWMLPILQPEGQTTTQTFTVRVRRIPIEAEGAKSAVEPDLLTDEAASLFLKDSRSGEDGSSSAGDDTPTRSPSPGESEASSSFRPLSPASTTSETLVDTSDDDTDQDGDDPELVSQLEALAITSSRASRAKLPMAATIDPRVPFGSRSAEAIITTAEALGPLSNNLRYTEKLDWSYTFPTTMLHLVYTDTLPRGDAIPHQLRPSHRQSGEQWSIDFAARTLYHKPALPRATRQRLWQAITSTAGLPCRIGNGIVTVNLGLAPRHNYFKAPSSQLRNGAALLRVIPNPPHHACQPSGASPEASYFLNRYQLVLQQGNHTFPATKPLAAYVDHSEEVVYCLLAQAASTASSPRGSAAPAAKMVYGQHPPPMLGFTDMFNVGVRLRDGGVRFPVINKGPKRRRLLMPGMACWHALYGDYDNIGIIKRNDPVESNKTREVNLRLPVPAGKQDVLFRVQEHEEGRYEVLEYAFRKQGSCLAVKEGEWMRVVPGRHLDGWVVEFFLNLARESVGLKEGKKGGH